jgi:outer membrane protein assembly factor BamB
MKKSCLLFLIFMLASCSIYASWPQFQKDCKHTGSECDVTINLPLCIKQMYPVGKRGTQAGIALIDDNGGMYYNNANSIQKLDLTTGQFAWTAYPGVHLIPAPGVFYNNTVIFEYTNGFICLDAITGAVLWTKSVAGMTGTFIVNSGVFGNSPFPTLSNGHIYCGTSAGEIAVVNASTGGTEHVFKVTTNYIVSAPAVDDDGSLYFGAQDGYFYSINGATGALNWRVATGTTVLSSPSVDSTGVYCTNSGLAKVFKCRKTDGALLWTNYTTGFNNGSGALYGDSYYLGSDDRYVYRFNKDTGTIIWTTYVGDNFANMSAIVVCGKVFIAGCINKLAVLDSDTGKEGFDCLSLDANFSNLSYWNKNLVFTSVDGNLYVIGECDPSCGACSCDSSKQTPTLTWTNSPTPSTTASVTFTPTITLSSTITSSYTVTPTITPSLTSTITDTVTCTFSPTLTFTTTSTYTVTPTRTVTPTSTPTATVTNTALPCDGITKPGFSVTVNYTKDSNGYLEIDIVSTSRLPDPPSVIICTGSAPAVSEAGVHTLCHAPACVTYTAIPASGDNRTFVLMYSKSNSGDFVSITASGADYCGITGKSDGTFSGKTPDDQDVRVLKNVINPDREEKTTLQCRVYSDCRVTAKVYSRTGNLVKTICSNEQKPAGECAISWDGTNNSGSKVASGIYILNFSTPTYSKNVKVCVLRQ